jgi:hypothetical protein
MQPWQTSHPSQIQATQQSAARRRSVGNLIGIVLGSLFASCFVCGGIATLLEDEPDAAERAPSTPGQLPAAAEPKSPDAIGQLTPAECIAAYEHAQILLPRMKLQPPPAEICAPKHIEKWGPDAATELRCVASATSPGALQLCGGHWMGTVSDYMAKFGDAVSVGDSSDVAADLGLGARAREHLTAVANAYDVPARTVGDKAARTAELCLGGMEVVAARPAAAVRKVEGALEFAAGVAGDTKDAGLPTAELMPLDDLFVTYVTMKCPDPSTSG